MVIYIRIKNMVKYLENNICEFELDFDIDYTKKVNILTTCFFKMDKHYKNFNTYINGLKRLVNMLDKQDEYVLRIFIDMNVKNDKEIMNVLKSSNKIQIVIFKCGEYMKNNFHIDVFGALVRLFPVFNFPNNDAENVICIDIDLNSDDIKSLRRFLYYKTKDVQIIGRGIISALLMSKVRPHFFCGLTGFFNKKYDSHIITDFILNAPNIKDKGIYGKREKPFGYGTDELFLNDYFIYYKDYTKTTELGLMYDYDINWFIFHYKDDMLKENPRETREYLSIILDDLYDKNMSTEELFNLIDKKIYQVEPFNPEKIKLTKNYYKLIKMLVNEDKEWFDKENMKLINDYYQGVIQCMSVVFYDRKDMHIFKVVNLNTKKLIYKK